MNARPHSGTASAPADGLERCLHGVPLTTLCPVCEDLRGGEPHDGKRAVLVHVLGPAEVVDELRPMVTAFLAAVGQLHPDWSTPARRSLTFRDSRRITFEIELPS